MARIPAFASSTSHAPGRVPIVADIQTNVNTGQAGVALGQGIAQLGNAGERFALSIKKTQQANAAAKLQLQFLEADDAAWAASQEADPSQASSVYSQQIGSFIEGLDNLEDRELRDAMINRFADQAKRREIGIRRESAGRVVKESIDTVKESGLQLADRLGKDDTMRYDDAAKMVDEHLSLIEGQVGKDVVDDLRKSIKPKLLRAKIDFLFDTGQYESAEALASSDEGMKYLSGHDIRSVKDAAKKGLDSVSEHAVGAATNDLRQRLSHVFSAKKFAAEDFNESMQMFDAEMRILSDAGTRNEVLIEVLTPELEDAAEDGDGPRFEAIVDAMPTTADARKEVNKHRKTYEAVVKRSQESDDLAMELDTRIQKGESLDGIPITSDVLDKFFRMRVARGESVESVAADTAEAGLRQSPALMRELNDRTRGGADLPGFASVMHAIDEKNHNQARQLLRENENRKLAEDAFYLTRNMKDPKAISAVLDKLVTPQAASISEKSAALLSTGVEKLNGGNAINVLSAVKNAYGRDITMLLYEQKKEFDARFTLALIDQTGQSAEITEEAISKATSDATAFLGNFLILQNATGQNVPARAELFGVGTSAAPDEVGVARLEASIAEISDAPNWLTQYVRDGLDDRPWLSYREGIRTQVPFFDGDGNLAAAMEWNVATASPNNVLRRGDDGFEEIERKFQKHISKTDGMPNAQLYWQPEYGDKTPQNVDASIVSGMMELAKEKFSSLGGHGRQPNLDNEEDVAELEEYLRPILAEYGWIR